MCGICGYISRKRIGIQTLEKMNDSMLHRGPDDSGAVQLEASDGYTVGMGHRRLAIMDLSSMGHQPMFSLDNNVCIVYNGEIYNFCELKIELQLRGYNFISQCDTEVVIAAYQEWGIDCFERFNGMFAIAIWDQKKEKLILARDRMGKKPLYYFINDRGDFVWASELKPIMAFPDFKRNIRTELIASYLCRNYIKAPDTIFENTYKLEPGQYIVWYKGEISKFYYWCVVEKYQMLKNSRKMDFNVAKDELRRLLLDSVNKRMLADVPVGVFLSGGIDSTLVASIAQVERKERVRTFTIGFNEKEQNEAAYAKQIARYLGTDHTEFYLEQNDLLSLIDQIPIYYDEPFADSSQIPSMLVAELAKEKVSVVLSGDGGDELFCGYGSYDNLVIAQRADWGGGILYLLQNSKLLHDNSLWKKVPYGMQAVIQNRNPNGKVQLFATMDESFTKAMVKGNSNSTLFINEKDIGVKNWQIKKMLLDMQSYLPDEILTKVDRASMKYSLETRCPLLDYRVVEYSFQIPHKFKYYKGDKKHILKSILYDIVPSRLLDRPKKGFSVPRTIWFRTCLKNKLSMYTNREIIERQGIFNYAEIRKYVDIIQKERADVLSSIIWAFLVFQMWYQTYIEDLWNR